MIFDRGLRASKKSKKISAPSSSFKVYDRFTELRLSFINTSLSGTSSLTTNQIKMDENTTILSF